MAPKQDPFVLRFVLLCVSVVLHSNWFGRGVTHQRCAQVFGHMLPLVLDRCLGVEVESKVSYAVPWP